MFGISLIELITLLIIALIFIKPKDLPEIMRFIGKIIYRGKKLYHSSKNSLNSLAQESGIDDLKQEIQKGINDEKNELENNFTVIVDIDGNEHKVPNLAEIRPDLTKEEIEQEVATHNKRNGK